MTVELQFLRFGASTPVGRSWVSTCAAVRAGLSRLTEHPFMFDAKGRPVIGAWATYLAPTLTHEQRLRALAEPALRELLRGVEIDDHTAVGLVLSVPPPRPGLPDDLTTTLIDVVAQGCLHAVPEFTDIRTVAIGNAGGLSALAVAEEIMRDGEVELCLVGGIDSWFDPVALEWLDQQGRLHGPQGPWGVLPGEAAAFALLGTTGLAQQLRAPVLASVAGLGLGQEAITIGRQEVCLGRGLTDAWRAALGPLSSDEQVTDIYLDRNAEPYRADEHGFSLVRCRDDFVDPSRFWTPVNAWGDAGAATGLLLAQLAVAAGLRGYARGPLAFVSTSSDTGQRAAAVLQLPT
ncbi:MAG: hypothetical protein K0V04_13570 [Deltaproteobacteria bacterium]|nr:hypothetical protein [Deltaproteobacteria bacterium]